MTIKEILLFLPTYPDATPDDTLESAAFLAQRMEARLTALIPQLDSDQASWPSPLGSWPVDVRGLMDETVQQSEHNAQASSMALVKLAADYRVTADLRRGVTALYAPPDALIALARLHDLTLMPVPECNSFDRAYLQAVIFNSGRPTLLLPSGRAPLQRLDSVVVAWDGSREAARALADAMPILTLARRVHVLSVFGEKGLETGGTAADLDRYLAAHRVNYTRADRTLTQGTIDTLFADYAAEAGADLLVMGAYGHSRFREFVLGGATKGMVTAPPLPVLLSH